MSGAEERAREIAIEGGGYELPAEKIPKLVEAIAAFGAAEREAGRREHTESCAVSDKAKAEWARGNYAQGHADGRRGGLEEAAAAVPTQLECTGRHDEIRALIRALAASGAGRDGRGEVKSEFRRKLEVLINVESMENGSNTPDFILAEHLLQSLEAFDLAVKARDEWYGVAHAPGELRYPLTRGD